MLYVCTLPGAQPANFLDTLGGNDVRFGDEREVPGAWIKSSACLSAPLGQSHQVAMAGPLSPLPGWARMCVAPRSHPASHSLAKGRDWTPAHTGAMRGRAGGSQIPQIQGRAQWLGSGSPGPG